MELALANLVLIGFSLLFQIAISLDEAKQEKWKREALKYFKYVA